MTTLQAPETPAKTETLADLCDQYGVAKLVLTTFDQQHVVFYRDDRPGPGIMQFLELQAALTAALSQPVELISAGAPCIRWPEYQKAIQDGVILYQL